MEDEVKTERKKPGPKPKEKPATYENTSKRNIFTELGRCGAGCTQELTAEQAEQFECLKKL